MSKLTTPASASSALPKLCGADIELGNFIIGPEPSSRTGYEASRALLAEIHGLPLRETGCYGSYYYGNPGYGRGHGTSGYNGRTSNSYSCDYGAENKNNAGASGASSQPAYNPQELNKRFLSSNGGSAYIDLDHVELCIPEVLSAFEHVAAWHAMLGIARDGLRKANQCQPAGQRIQVLVNNSDGQGNSYGSHLNFLVHRRTWDNIFCRKAHYLQFLASLQVSSILFGQGKVGVENGRPAVPYQLSQRADFFATLQAPWTTYDRPIVNSRDEALCGRNGFSDPSTPARLHVIFFDSALAHGSALLRVGVMQLVLTLMELGLVNSRLILDDPLDAVIAFSHDPTLKARAALISGRRFTALDLQSAYLEEVKRYGARGVFEGIVPFATEIIALWEDTLDKLMKANWLAVAPRLDWVMKLMAIERAMQQRPNLGWDSPEIRVLDLLYSSLDDDGLYWAYEASGFAEQLVAPERIVHFVANPPADTRAWTRAMLLRRAAPEDVVSVDWDAITFKLRGRSCWPSYRTVHLADPLGFSQAEAEPIFENCPDFETLLDALDGLSPRTIEPLSIPLAN